MICLCCGKMLDESLSIDGWHKACVKKFFGTKALPSVELDDSVLTQLAKNATDKGVTIPGVQKKLSLHLLSGDDAPRLTLLNYPTGYILKPQVSEFEALPECEHLIMTMAKCVGITTVPHALIGCGSSLAYITRRIDRVLDAQGVSLLAMEDFCQLDLRLTEDKYRSSYERCAKIIARYSSRVGIDQAELFVRLVFSFIVGNSDMHLKNFSMIETFAGSGKYVLSPAYDLLPVNIILPQDTEECALTLNGKRVKIRKADFLAFANQCGIATQTAERLIRQVLSKKESLLQQCQGSLLPNDLKIRLAKLIEMRINAFDII